MPRASGHRLRPRSEADTVVAGYAWLKKRQEDVAWLKTEWTQAPPPKLPDSPQLLVVAKGYPAGIFKGEKVKASESCNSSGGSLGMLV
ncbi:hypothetical protein TURU_000989 [Turdus rufiventris]|nr:hypothetical protein TURU_000989 [Turdus rufiventris]